MSGGYKISNIFTKCVLTSAACFLIFASASQAQIFNPSAPKAAAPKPTAPVVNRTVVPDSADAAVQPAPKAVEKSTPRPASLAAEIDYAPKERTNSGNEDKRRNNMGSFSIRFVGDDVVIGEAPPRIDLYMKDFKISKSIGDRVSCSMRFFVRSTIKEKISNISYRLRWPGMETGVSFDNVEPDVPTYFAYTLLGEGCYNMDKTPNIVVNRCRIKGFTQQQCASVIHWLN